MVADLTSLSMMLKDEAERRLKEGYTFKEEGIQVEYRKVTGVFDLRK